MSNAWTRAPSSFRCEEIGCENRTYSTASNLARHIQSMHGEPVQMPCGMIRQNHPWNSRRHQLGCSGCRATLGLPPLGALGSPILDDTLSESGHAHGTLDVVGAPILDDFVDVVGPSSLENTLGELSNALDIVGAPIVDDNLGARDNIFDDFGIPILDDTVDEFDDALAIDLRDYSNFYCPGFLYFQNMHSVRCYSGAPPPSNSRLVQTAEDADDGVAPAVHSLWDNQSDGPTAKQAQGSFQYLLTSSDKTHDTTTMEDEYASNIKRHKDTCGCVVLVQPPVPAVGHGVGTDNTADTTTTPTFDVTHMMLNGFNMEYYPADLIFYGPY
ncbi:uncharacterized protein BDZ83DRAFT_734547 [Colletotrichum acutatum]|uniref:C2H2-type domain-containing protein n=1 Tax=Glomerella acutata TaxID=27357 RepID=A0AAD8U9C6_GLOAC|nr:uncharacterized protein BDZ83DRAFT_734547 [Colletotrichum acutatum]KAK1714106.1 hypothetical protein BDZ83DRAFT_734547 [Colletotrichum acutatum]